MNHVMHRKIAAAAGAVVLSALVGCGGTAATDGGGSLSVDRLVTLSEEVGKDGADACPIAYDTAKAGEAAELGEGIEPGAAGAEAGRPVAGAEGGKTTDPQSPWAGKAGAWITCSYHVGTEDLDIHTAGTEGGRATNLLLPRAQSAGGMSIDELKLYSEKAAKTKPGEAVPNKSGNVVTVRLDSGGKGEVALLLTVGESGKSTLKPQQVLELARAFAAQAK